MQATSTGSAIDGRFVNPLGGYIRAFGAVFLILLTAFTLFGLIILAAGGEVRGGPPIMFPLVVGGMYVSTFVLYRLGRRREQREVEILTEVLHRAAAAEPA